MYLTDITWGYSMNSNRPKSLRPSIRPASIRPRSIRPSLIPPEHQITVLIVEDSQTQVRTFRRQLDNHVKLLICDSWQQGQRLFDEYRNAINIIFLDGTVLRGETTELLLKHIRESEPTYKGIVVSITASHDLKDKMAPLEEGSLPDTRPRCDRHIPKTQVYGFVVGYLSNNSL